MNSKLAIYFFLMFVHQITWYPVIFYILLVNRLCTQIQSDRGGCVSLNDDLINKRERKKKRKIEEMDFWLSLSVYLLSVGCEAVDLTRT